MKTLSFVLGVAGLLVAAASAVAQNGAGISLGTTGVGLHLSKSLHEKLNARIGINALNYSYDTSTSTIDYDLTMKLRMADLLLDWFPTGSAFRISGGIVYNGNEIDATGVPNAAGNYTLNGTTYSIGNVGTLNGRIDFRNAAPYLGIGWGNVPFKESGWGITADLGVLFQGSPHTSLASTHCTAPVLVCSQFATDLAAENLRLEDEADSFKAYPVARVGISFRF